jgi:hypothetical protein
MKLFVKEGDLTRIYSEGFQKGIEVGYNVGVKIGRGEVVMMGIPREMLDPHIKAEIEEILRRTDGKA